jgi:hypothetical protein
LRERQIALPTSGGGQMRFVDFSGDLDAPGVCWS